jgi:hypothetical protein
MLAEEYLHEKPKPPPPEPELSENIPLLSHPNAYPTSNEMDLTTLKETAGFWLRRTKNFFKRIFKKR